MITKTYFDTNTRQQVTKNFSTLSDLVHWETVECSKEGFDYEMYVDYLHQALGQPDLAYSKEKYNKVSPHFYH